MQLLWEPFLYVPTVCYVPKMLGQDYFLNVRSARILLRSTLVPNVACVVNWAVETNVSNVGLKNEQTLMIFNVSTLSIIKRH